MEIVIETYNEKWPENFLKEKKKIEQVFGHALTDIFHIGSTAIPGLSAKPTIDMMPVVQDISIVDTFNDEMIGLGYTPLGENGIKGRRFYTKGVTQRTHHVHIYQSDDRQNIDRHLSFKEYLIAHPESAKAYEKIKIELAQQFSEDRAAYTEGKNEFIADLEKNAFEWYKKNFKPEKQ